MDYNSRIVTVKITRHEVCDLLGACTGMGIAVGGDNKWHKLHDKLRAILDEFDEKHKEDIY